MVAAEQEFIHRFVPAKNSAASTRTLLLLHGTGGDENDLLPLGPMLDPGAAVLSPRGRVLENGMPRFFRRLREGVFDEDDLIQRAHELAAFVERAAILYKFDPSRVTAVGFSNGANIAAGLLLLRPTTLAEAVLFHPMVPLVPERLPCLSGVRVLVSAGRFDPIAPPEQAEQLVRMLREAGADASLQWQAGRQALSREEVEQEAGWLSKQ